jgi:hypothetical protein
MKSVYNPILDPMVATMSSLRVMSHEWRVVEKEQEFFFFIIIL